VSTKLSFVTKYLTVRKSFFFMICGLIAFTLYLYFFVGFNQIFLVVANVNLAGYVGYYSLAFGFLIIVMLLWVSAWKSLLKARKIKVGLRNAFLYYWTGYFVDLIVPCQQVCGEVTRLYLVQKETRENYGAIGAASITNRVLGYSIVTVGLSSGIIFLIARAKIPAFAINLLVLSWIGAMAYLSVLLYLAIGKKAAENLAAFILKILKALRIKRYRSGDNLSPGLLESLKSFGEGFKFFRENPRYLIKPAVFQMIAYVLNFAIYVLVFYALGFDNLLFDFFILVYFLAGAVQDATSAFSVGALEILLTNIFIFFGIAPAASVVAATVLRSITFWLPLIIGYIIVQVVGAKKLLSPKVREKIQAQQEKNLPINGSGPSLPTS
jgi:glycosyltransferase 2 family protein